MSAQRGFSAVWPGSAGGGPRACHHGRVPGPSRSDALGPSLFDSVPDAAGAPTSGPPSGQARGPERASAPLAARMRPDTLDELVGQAELVAPGSPLRRLIEGSGATSLLLWGPPGTGKTTLASLVSRAGGRRFVELSAVTAGVKDVRAAIDEARLHMAPTVLFIDEVHRFTRTQQDALLPAVEHGWVTFVGATTENPSFSVIAPLLSRSLLLTLKPLGDEEIGVLLDRAVADERGLGGRVRLAVDARADLVRLAGGDARRALTYLEAAAQGASSRRGAEAPELAAEHAGGAGDPHRSERHPEATVAQTRGADDAPPSARSVPEVTAALVAAAVDRALVRYDRSGDQHYDVISAFIKSVRGSDVDAALHYLARMIEAGEDPRFIARRLAILASEDVGLADPTALGVATAAMTAVAQIGMPEGRLPLAQATIHLAVAPKSNAVIRAIDAAQADVRSGRIGVVPAALRDGHYAGARDQGVRGYVYPHDDPAGVVAQQYPPDRLVGRVYYEPTDRGVEARLGDRVEWLRSTVNGTKPEAP